MLREPKNVLMHILLIEDNPDHIFLARQAIGEAWRDALLHVAHDLSQVRALLSSPRRPARFDLILVALDWGDANRLVRLRDLQAFSELDTAPIIALVSSTRDQELAQVANHPIDQIVLKPLRAEALREVIRRRPLP
ncbi:MAG: hypothetical protein ACRDGG_01780 [Anaerolineae bacterium]